MYTQYACICQLCHTCTLYLELFVLDEILLVDQEIREALKIADYVYVLELGRNKFEGPASEFDDLEKAFWA